MVGLVDKVVNGFGHLNGNSKQNGKSSVDQQAVLQQLSKLSLEEKISLLSGADHWHTAAVPRLGIPKVRTSDGPVSPVTAS